MTELSEKTIIDQLATSNWNQTKGNHLSISYSFFSQLPVYYDVKAIKDSKDYRSNQAKLFIESINVPINNKDFKGFNPGQINAVGIKNDITGKYTGILKAWNDVANIDFVKMEDNDPNAVITLGNVKFNTNIYGLSAGNPHSDFFQGQNYYGDVWLNTDGVKGRANLNETTPGQNGYLTILHEIGHALGLNHTFFTNPLTGKNATNWTSGRI